MSRLQDITTFTDTVIDDLDYFWINEIGTSTATLSIASPCVVTKTSHGLEVGNKISFTTSGALPTGITASTEYYIISSGFGANSFQISATYNGTAINTSGTQSGTHTYTAYVSKKMSGEKLKTLIVPSTPSSEVSFDKLTPTTVGVVFDPNTPATTDILYYSTVDGSTWIYNGTAYVSKTIPNSTEFNIDGFFVDAGSNKTSTISRNGSIKVRENNTSLSRFTQLFSYGIQIVSDVYAQITQTAISDTLYPLTRMTRKRGTITSQTNALNNDTLGIIAWSGGGNDSAQIFAQATENHSGNVGTSIYFQNATTGSSGLTTSHWVDGTAKLNVMLGLKCDYSTTNTIASFNASKELVSLSTSTYPSLTELSYVKGLTAPLGTLATQNGTFSGTSSGTNTGDQIISDATLTTSDITTNDVSITKHGFVPKAPNNTTQFLRGDGTWGTPASGGLTYFTEAQTTAAPNETVYANSLTAVSSTANADFIIKPKGTGAFIVGHIPDGTTLNGGKRGAGAIELMSGSMNYYAGAQGVNSVAIGTQVEAKGSNSIAIGRALSATNTGSIAIGTSNGNVSSGLNSFALNAGTASNTNAVALNGTASGPESFASNNSTASGANSVALGGAAFSQAIASANNSIAIGESNTSDARSSICLGMAGSTKGVAQRLSLGSHQDIAPYIRGNSQLSLSSSTITTTTNTVGELLAYGGTAINLVLQNNEAIRVKGSIIGKQTASTNVSCYDFDCIVVRGATAGSTILPLSNVNLVLDTITLDIIPTLTANTTLGGLSVKSGAKTTTTIKWSCRIDSTEVILA